MANYDWSAPETYEPFVYTNDYGEVVLTPVTNYLPVSEIEYGTVPEIENVLLTMDEAEQVTLITENRRAYVSWCLSLLEQERSCFALQYSCRNRAAVCRVEIRRFEAPDGRSAQQQLEHIHSRTLGPLPVE